MKIKRWVAVLLCVLLIDSLFPTGAFAADIASGTGWNLDADGVLHITGVPDMSYMFMSCSSLTSLDVSGFKTDSLMYAEEMFRGCSALTSLRIRPDILYKNADVFLAIAYEH